MSRLTAPGCRSIELSPEAMAVATDSDLNMLAARRDERRAAAVACGAHALHDGYTDLIYVMLPI